MLSGPKTWFGIPSLSVGLAFTSFALWELADANRIAVDGVRAQGTVVELRRSGGRRGTSYRPIVSFATPDGTTHSFAHRLATRPPAYGVGDSVAVLYDPKTPARAVIDSFYGRFAFLFVALFTSGFAVLGAWLIRSDRREQNQLEP